MRRSQLFEPVSSGQLIFALLLLVALATSVAYVTYKGVRWGAYAVAWMQAFIFLHGVAHLLMCAWFLEYVPGLATGTLLLPISCHGYRQARKCRRFGRKTAAALLISAVLLYDPVLRLAFKAGAIVIDERPQDESPPPDRGTPANVASGSPATSSSKQKLKSNLYLAWILGGEVASESRRECNPARYVREIGVIESIEELRPEL